MVSQSLPWRVHRSLIAAIHGSRVHPSAVLFGAVRQIVLERGCVVGPRTRILPRASALVVVGADAWLSSDIEIDTESSIRIGARTTIQRRGTINGSTRIGCDCILAPNVFISSGAHPFRVVPHLTIREQERYVAGLSDLSKTLDLPVWVQNDCWIGVNAVVCPGVTVGKGSVVGANSVVTRDVHPYSVVAGAPARIVGVRLDWQPPLEIRADRAEDLPYVLSGLTQSSRLGRQPEIEITPAEKLIVALRKSARSVLLAYRSDADIHVVAGGKTAYLSAGEGVANFDLQAGSNPDTPLLFELNVVPRNVFDRLFIQRISATEA
jgi:acetyltransferase-like isoleucine patch superfamily enzyme